MAINFQIPASWSELSDKQLRKVYELIAADYDADDKSCQREQSGACSDYAEILPHLDRLEQISPQPVRLAIINGVSRFYNQSTTKIYADNRPLVHLSASKGIFTSPFNIIFS